MDRSIALRERQASNPHGFYFTEQPPLVVAARQALATHLSVSTSELFLLPNVTWAINLGINASMHLRGDRKRVVLADLEYGALSSAWQLAAKAHGMSVTIVPIADCTSREQIVERYRIAMGRDVCVLFASHVVSANGWKLPVSELGGLAREAGAFSIIDGAHALGLVDPLELNALGVDAYGANLHKWMMGVATSGFFWCGRTQLRDAIRPPVVSWGAIALDLGDGDKPMPWFGGTRVQAAVEFSGSTDRIAQLTIPETVSFYRHLQPQRMLARMRELQDYAIGKLSPHLAFRSAPHGCDTPALCVFDFPACDRGAFRDWMLREHNVGAAVTRVREDIEGVPGKDLPRENQQFFLRVSTAWWNTEEDVDRLTHAIEEILRVKPITVFKT